MRELIAKTIAVLGAICAFAVAGLWAYFVWTNDWGQLGMRGRGLWLMGLTTGTILVFIIVGGVGLWIATIVDPDAL
jgi:hypothetical protein